MKKGISLLLLLFSLSACIPIYTANYSRMALQNEDYINDLYFEDIDSLKEGESCITSSFSIIPFFLIFRDKGDFDIIKATKSAGITKIKLVDYKITKGLFSKDECLVVYGE